MMLPAGKWFVEALEDVEGLPRGSKSASPEPWEKNNMIFDRISGYLRTVSFDDYLAFVDKTFNFFAKKNVYNLKSASCFARSLKFVECTKKEAKKAFETLQSELYSGLRGDLSLWGNELNAFEDYIFYYCLRKAREYNCSTIQIHTGHNTGDTAEARPILLEELISKNPDLNFILLHGGKYYFEDVLNLCGKYNNVYADFTWIPLIAPELAEKMVYKFIKYFPMRTSAGLDMANIEGAAGMSQLNRDIISKTLTRLCREKVYSTDKASEIGISIISTLSEKLFYARTARNESIL